jgi:hypothetical protein
MRTQVSKLVVDSLDDETVRSCLQTSGWDIEFFSKDSVYATQKVERHEYSSSIIWHKQLQKFVLDIIVIDETEHEQIEPVCSVKATQIASALLCCCRAPSHGISEMRRGS